MDRTVGDREEARQAFADAMAIYKLIDDRPGQADVLFGLGVVESQLGQIEKARDAYRKAE